MSAYDRLEIQANVMVKGSEKVFCVVLPVNKINIINFSRIKQTVIYVNVIRNDYSKSN